jgi:hypothetical protein
LPDLPSVDQYTLAASEELSWKQVAYGPKHSLRRLSWIKPYKTEEHHEVMEQELPSQTFIGG